MDVHYHGSFQLGTKAELRKKFCCGLSNQMCCKGYETIFFTDIKNTFEVDTRLFADVLSVAELYGAPGFARLSEV